jgi:hypothetical protein
MAEEFSISTFRVPSEQLINEKNYNRDRSASDLKGAKKQRVIERLERR